VGTIVVPLPRYQTPGASGMDLHAALEAPLVLKPLERALVGTGLILGIPPKYEGQVRPRSGLALKHGVTIVNAPGTIDSDYRGEIKVLLVNLGAKKVTIQPLDRIAQLVIAPVATAQLDELSSIEETVRGAGGYGSTGAR
jgi:dUTP pyrophosphatase